MENDQQLKVYLAASAAVQRRVGLIGFADWLKRGHLVIGLAGVFLVVCLRRILGWGSNEVLPLLGLLVLWMVVGLLMSLRRQPEVLESLIALDHSGAWKDRFASAWAFLNQDACGVGEQLHIDRAGRSLDAAVEQFPIATPLPDLRKVWILPLTAVIFALTPLLRIPPDAADSVLTEEMVEAAGGQAEQIARETNQLDGLKALSEEEQELLNQLRVDLDEVTRQLADAEGLTAGEMLEALEDRARAVERLARDVGEGAEDWASEAFLKAMSEYSDTADMAVAVSERNAEAVADEATALQQILNAEAMNAVTKERLEHSLVNIQMAGEEIDQTKPVGERFGNAADQMESAQPRQAAREFEELARHFRVIQKREEASKSLESLAKSLREAGSEISGKELEKMEEIARASQGDRALPEGLKGLDSDDFAKALDQMVPPQSDEDSEGGEMPKLAGGDGEPQAPPVPGTGQEDQSGGGQGQKLLKAPIPGEGPPKGEGGQSMAMNSGAEEKGDSLSAPIPGMSPGDSQDAGGASGPGGQPGKSSISGQGGDQAGTGTAELVDTESDLHKAGADSKVVAQINDDGESTFRSIEGEARQEEVSRSRREVAAEFIAVEEQALDGKSLPLSRRQHVVRYFSAIRQQFEKEDE